MHITIHTLRIRATCKYYGHTCTHAVVLVAFAHRRTQMHTKAHIHGTSDNRENARTQERARVRVCTVSVCTVSLDSNRAVGQNSKPQFQANTGWLPGYVLPFWHGHLAMPTGALVLPSLAAGLTPLHFGTPLHFDTPRGCSPLVLGANGPDFPETHRVLLSLRRIRVQDMIEVSGPSP